MRQRGVLRDEIGSPASPVLRRVAAVDLFAKPKEDFQRRQTSAGAIVSSVTVGIITILVLWEGIGYAVGWNAYDTDLTIDSNPNRSMEVNIDITFPRNSCADLSVDIRDAAGTRRINVTRSLRKIPLDNRGAPALAGSVASLGESDESVSDVEPDPACGSCFLAGDIASAPVKAFRETSSQMARCCSTCDDVLRAYGEAGLGVPARSRIPQCLEEAARRNPGCRVLGTLHLKKVSGSLVFAPRQIKQAYHFDEVFRFRTDHTINRLVIGSLAVKRFSKSGSVSQLEGHEYRSHGSLSEVKYFLSVVPTTYNTRRRQPNTVRTYEYAVQWRARSWIAGYGGIPAVMFSFDFSPIQINNYFIRAPLSQFLIKLCGIIGGLFVVLGVVDRVVARVLQWYS